MEEEKVTKHDNHEEHKPIHTHHKSKETLTEKFRENPWMLSTIVLGILSLMLIIGSFSGGASKIISEADAGKIMLDFANARANEEIESIELVDVKPFGYSLYEVTLSLDGQNMPLYLTKDGENWAQGVMSMAALMEKAEPQEPEVEEIPKSDKPKAELFVMTHCPYGTQAEKGFIPAIKALAETIDAKIRFVHYFMHEPEETETPRQVCIREEQGDKFLDYLECFLEGDGESPYVGNNPSTCMQKVGINEAKVQECIDNGNAAKYYEEDSKLSQTYGVQGSPTLIVNGVQSHAGRDAANYLGGICEAFNNAPEECQTEVSSATPSPGFGYSVVSSSSTTQCS